MGFPDPAVSTCLVHQLLFTLSNSAGAEELRLNSTRLSAAVRGIAHRLSSVPKLCAHSCSQVPLLRLWWVCERVARPATGAWCHAFVHTCCFTTTSCAISILRHSRASSGMRSSSSSSTILSRRYTPSLPTGATTPNSDICARIAFDICVRWRFSINLTR